MAMQFIPMLVMWFSPYKQKKNRSEENQLHLSRLIIAASPSVTESVDFLSR